MRISVLYLHTYLELLYSVFLVNSYESRCNTRCLIGLESTVSRHEAYEASSESDQNGGLAEIQTAQSSGL